MPNPTIQATTATINLALNNIIKKQTDEINRAVSALPVPSPSSASASSSSSKPMVVPLQTNSSLPKG